MVPRMVSCYLVHLIKRPIPKLRIRISTIFWPLNYDKFYHSYLIIVITFLCNMIVENIQKNSEFVVWKLVIWYGEQYSLHKWWNSQSSLQILVYLLLERSKFPPTCLGKFWLVLGINFLTNQRRPHVWADITSI